MHYYYTDNLSIHHLYIFLSLSPLFPEEARWNLKIPWTYVMQKQDFYQVQYWEAANMHIAYLRI